MTWSVLGSVFCEIYQNVNKYTKNGTQKIVVDSSGFFTIFWNFDLLFAEKFSSQDGRIATVFHENFDFSHH